MRKSGLAVIFQVYLKFAMADHPCVAIKLIADDWALFDWSDLATFATSRNVWGIPSGCVRHTSNLISIFASHCIKSHTKSSTTTVAQKMVILCLESLVTVSGQPLMSPTKIRPNSALQPT